MKWLLSRSWVRFIVETNEKLKLLAGREGLFPPCQRCKPFNQFLDRKSAGDMPPAAKALPEISRNVSPKRTTASRSTFGLLFVFRAFSLAWRAGDINF
jgi:hypothetical protein